MLESALARPLHLHRDGEPRPDLADLAASLAFGLARNHPFIDGNRRTAHVCYRSFLQLNGASLHAELDEKYAVMMAVADGRLDERGFADWLRPRIRVNADARVQEPVAAY